VAVRKKQGASQEEWLGAVALIKAGHRPPALDEKVALAVGRIRQWCCGKNAAVSWSGGKDSLVTGHLAETAGVARKFIVLSDLEYRPFVDWLADNTPDGLRVERTHQDLEWLRDHPTMLFPTDAATSGRWFSAVQHRGQRRFFKDYDMDVLLLGRRWAEGNFTGKRPGEMIYENRQGVVRASPVADWTHEEVLAYLIHDMAAPVPPFYYWPRGFRVGTGPWAKRRPGDGQTRDDMWEEIKQIDPEILESAGRYFPEARRCL